MKAVKEERRHTPVAVAARRCEVSAARRARASSAPQEGGGIRARERAMDGTACHTPQRQLRKAFMRVC